MPADGSTERNADLSTRPPADVSPHVAVVHYPEGAGHATRMMGVARGLERRGATVSLAGGGDGRRLYAPNGYDVYEPPTVDFVADYQRAADPLRGLCRVVTGSLPDAGRRLRAARRWLAGVDPAAVVVDDMFAAAAVATTDRPLYVLSHDAGALYRDPLVSAPTRLANAGQRAVARRFFCPTVWPPSGADIPGASRVPPVALPPPADADTESGAGPGPRAAETVLVPSAYSTDFEATADRLRATGHDVTLVGDENWTPVPSLLPVLRRAETVVCSGYSTVMEAAVAGTHCVVCPATNEQAGVARRLRGVEGFTVAGDATAVEAAVAADRPAPDFPNGVAAVAGRILDDL